MGEKASMGEHSTVGSYQETGRGLASGEVTTCNGEWVARTGKNLPAMRETQVRSLGQVKLLEKEMATHSSTLAWKIPWTEESGRLQPRGSQRIEHD